MTPDSMPTAERKDFFISYTLADERWAEWIGWTLEEAGYSVVIQAWDFRPGQNFVELMDRATREADRTIAVLSRKYIESAFARSEWQAAFKPDPCGLEGRIVPVRVEDLTITGLLGQVIYIDLVSTSEGVAKEKLLTGVMSVRTKPQSAPRFPVLRKPARNQPPRFPAVSDAESADKGHPGSGHDIHPRIQEWARQRDQLALTGASPQELASKAEELVQIRRAIRDDAGPQKGTVLCDRYLLLEPIGEGGFAVVWKALDKRTSDYVAAKILHPSFSNDRTPNDRLFRGTREMKRLVHPNIVRVVEECCEHGDLSFVVLEYVEGGDLHNAVLRGGLDQDRVIEIIRDVASALAFAHERKVIHRDLKPANVLLTSGGVAQLTDFDLVRAAHTTGGTRGGLGTFPYAAPEAMNSAKDADERSDIFSFGMTALFALYGRELEHEAYADPVRFIDHLPCSRSLKNLLKRCVAKRPDRRYQSVVEVLEALYRSVCSYERFKDKSTRWAQVFGGLNTISPVTATTRTKAQRPVNPHPFSLGAVVGEGGTQFSVFSRSATGMRILLYDHTESREPDEVIEFDPGHRIGETWCGFVPDIGHGQLYHIQADGPWDPEHGHRFVPTARLIDPYARALAGDFQQADDGVIRPPRCVVIDDHFNWESDCRPQTSFSESVIYELHVRGFTISPTSRVQRPGTYLGLVEKIPYLQSLGITAVELMPVHEFPIRATDGRGLARANYWGYDPLALFAPHRGYAVGVEPGAQVTEFKTMVKALHQAGIEVVLDVVFNHTCEGGARGPVLSLKGLENSVYYLVENRGQEYANYSGCGNTLNCNHPVVRRMLLDCLRNWVLDYHVDGFRFDLASILCRGRDGALMRVSSLAEEICEDPIIGGAKLIAEAWDAGGAYQLGTFGGSRWSEWNGRYRDDVRRFWRGDGGMLGPIATRLAGSSDLYEHYERHPYSSINYIASHDGFTLNDLVSYRHKHNEANGEGNCDGDNSNFSENHGVEGPTDRPDVDEVRVRQIKNMLATLLLSQGVPMLLAGDECRRTQSGNNNVWCQDNEISWFDWDLPRHHRELVRFTRALIRFRRRQPTVRQRTFLNGRPMKLGERPDVEWFNAVGEGVRWDTPSQALACLLSAPPASQDPRGEGRSVLLLLNASTNQQEFLLPAASKADDWRLFINTACKAPHDIYPDLRGPSPPPSGQLTLASYSLTCYVGTRPSRLACATGSRGVFVDAGHSLEHDGSDEVPTCGGRR